MCRKPIVPMALALLGLLGPTVLSADVIHLRNGHRLEVEGWREAGEQIEFMMGGGIVRIWKVDVEKIDGKPSRGEFRMYSSGVSGSASAAPAEEKAAVGQMTGLLKQGEALFGQTVLSPPEKAGAFRRLAQQWRALEVPESLRPAQARGDAAIQMAIDAYAGPEDLPETKEKVEKARTELAAVQDEVKKAAPAPTEGGQG